MIQQFQDIIEKTHQVTSSVQEHMHLIDKCNKGHDEENPPFTVTYNNRLVLSDCLPFLEAVKRDIGGEIIDDPAIGHFLYYGDDHMN
jgi:hypothetical protein